LRDTNTHLQSASNQEEYQEIKFRSKEKKGFRSEVRKMGSFRACWIKEGRGALENGRYEGTRRLLSLVKNSLKKELLLPNTGQNVLVRGGEISVGEKTRM